MPGRRPLTGREQHSVIKVAQTLAPRERLYVTLSLFTGFRLSEVLRLRIGDVYRGGRILSQLGVPPSRLKGKRGSSRWVPIGPELARALSAQLAKRAAATPNEPLFEGTQYIGGVLQPASKHWAAETTRRVFACARVKRVRLGTHTFRKTFAQNIYERSGHDIEVTRLALGHRDIEVTQRYIERPASAVKGALLRADWTRLPRKTELFSK